MSGLPVEEVLKKTGFAVYGIHGDSMMPFLLEGTDTVRIVPVTGVLRVYDLPLYRRPSGQLVLHRIVKVNEKIKFYITAGDNRTTFEEVPFSWIVGVADGIYTPRASAWSGEDGGEATEEPVFIPADDPVYRCAVERVCANRKQLKKEKQTETEIPEDVWKTLLRLLRDELTGSSSSYEAGTDWTKVFRLARAHSVAALAFPAVPEELCPETVYGKWKSCSAQALRKEILFDDMRGKILAELERAGIRYLPMKGILLKDLYPAKGLREFADNDILYDQTRQLDVKKIMEGLGFQTVSLEWVHDTYHKEPLFNFEFHKGLFSDACPWKKYFDGVWEEVVPDGENRWRYRMTDGYFYAYFIAHMRKHYDGGGCGLRSFADLYLLQERFLTDASRAEAEERLKKAGLSGAEKDYRHLTDLLFRADIDAIPYGEIRYLLESGVYGTLQHRVDNEVKAKGRTKYLLSRAFPPYRTMRAIYPVLRKVPVLLPFCWGARILDPKKRDNAKREIRAFRNSDAGRENKEN